MKQLILLAISIYVAGASSPTVVDVGGDNWVDIIVGRKTCLEDMPTGYATPLPCVEPALSTGPYVLKATSGDCYRVPYINPNGTLPKSPADWVSCP